MENKPFKNKIALVTGSSRGIGKAIAIDLARRGANLVINYHRNQELAEATAMEIENLGYKVRVIQANIAKLEDIERMFATVESELGGLDIYISNAASGFNRPAMQQKPSGWDWTIDVNARGFLFSVQHAVKLMETRGGGKIVAISSPGSTRVLPDYVAVGASKAALESLVRYLAVELAPKNILVNAVSPGLVETDALKHFSSLADPDAIPRAVANTPCGRLVQPDDVAGIVSFLCSPPAEMICGQVIIVDGGFLLPAR